MAEVVASKTNGSGGFKWSNVLQWIMPLTMLIGLVINWNTMTIKLNQHEIDLARVQLLVEAEITRGNAALALKDADNEAKWTYADSLLSARQDAFRTRVDLLDGVIADLRTTQQTDDTATQVALGQLRVQLTYIQAELEKLEKP
jgi:hypothetical protein